MAKQKQAKLDNQPSEQSTFSILSFSPDEVLELASLVSLLLQTTEHMKLISVDRKLLTQLALLGLEAYLYSCYIHIRYNDSSDTEQLDLLNYRAALGDIYTDILLEPTPMKEKQSSSVLSLPVLGAELAQKVGQKLGFQFPLDESSTSQDFLAIPLEHDEQDLKRQVLYNMMRSLPQMLPNIDEALAQELSLTLGIEYPSEKD